MRWPVRDDVDGVAEIDLRFGFGDDVEGVSEINRCGLAFLIFEVLVGVSDAD